jgi:hypothetical protein
VVLREQPKTYMQKKSEIVLIGNFCNGEGLF